MKRITITFLIWLCAASALAQGTLHFANAAPNVNAPIWLNVPGSGEKLSGTDWIAQLWYGPLGSAESALVPHPATATFSTVGAQAGYFFGSARTLNGIPGGETAVVQVRVWNAAAGNTWAEAIASPIGLYGESYPLLNVRLGTPPETPPYLVGLQSFGLAPIPEPTSFALAGLGAATLLIFRRRRNKQATTSTP